MCVGWAGATLGNRDCVNEVGAVAEYIKRFGGVKSVAIEACTGSADFADRLRGFTGWNVKLCHPGYVRRMKNNPDKSDKTDALLIGDLNRVGYLPEVWLAPEGIRDLRVLARHLKEYEIVVAELRLCNERVKASIKGDRIAEELLKQKGSGFITAAVMRAEIGYFGRFRHGKQLSRFCGVTPKNASSGERQADAGLIKAGNSILKTAIIEAAQRLARYDAEWNKFAVRLLRDGKPKSVIIGAVANRWMRRLCYTMRAIEGTQCLELQPQAQAA